MGAELRQLILRSSFAALAFGIGSDTFASSSAPPKQPQHPRRQIEDVPEDAVDVPGAEAPLDLRHGRPRNFGSMFSFAGAGHGNISASEELGLSRDQERSLGFAHGKPAISPQPRKDNKIMVQLPKDRCYTGLITFGNIVCRVLGRGETKKSVDPRTGKETCVSYAKPTDENGATPTGTYSVKPRDPNDSRGATWGPVNPLRITRQPAGPYENRDGLLIHAVAFQEDRADLSEYSTQGCLKVHSDCLTKMNAFVAAQGGEVTMEVK